LLARSFQGYGEFLFNTCPRQKPRLSSWVPRRMLDCKMSRPVPLVFLARPRTRGTAHLGSRWAKHGKN